MDFPRCRGWTRSLSLASLALIALLILGGLPPSPATADPPRVGLASAAGGSADDVLGQFLNADFT